VTLSQSDGVVQVSVADAGPGVPPNECERIFDKFYIAAADKALAGVGLGLFICRELVRLHGGCIWVEDRPGRGSRFCFTLPIAAEDNADEES
jgi:signal transduction histidine kinase